MILKDILENKVLWLENLGDCYYWDYRIIVQIDEKKIVLLEYNDSMSGWIEFNVESVDKEFISSFFNTYDYIKDKKIKLNYESTEKLKDLLHYEFKEKELMAEIVILDIKDIEKYIMKE